MSMMERAKRTPLMELMKEALDEMLAEHDNEERNESGGSSLARLALQRFHKEIVHGPRNARCDDAYCDGNK